MVASSHYNSPQKHFSFFSGVFFPKSIRRVWGNYFFRHCTRIAAFWHDHPSWFSGVRDPNALLYRIIGVGRSRAAFVFLSLFYFCIFGSFSFYFTKKGYRLASGFGFLRNFVRMGWLLGRLFHLFTGSVWHDIFWGVSGWKKNPWFVFFSLSNILFPWFSLGIFEENSVGSHFRLSLLLTFYLFHTWWAFVGPPCCIWMDFGVKIFGAVCKFTDIGVGWVVWILNCN